MADAALSHHELETWNHWICALVGIADIWCDVIPGAIHKLAVALMRRGRMRTGEINELLCLLEPELRLPCAVA